MAVSTALLMWSSASLAQTRTWDGNGTPDSSGNWSIAVNWSGDDAPDTTDETAVLPDVGSGTRTVTVDASTTVGHVRLTQATAGAVNKLLLGAPLTIFSNRTTAIPFSLSPVAGLSSVQVDLNGQYLTVSNNQNIVVALDGTVTMGSGSQFDIMYGAGLNDNKGFVISNSGTLYQDHSTIRLIWGATSANNDGSGLGRNYQNTGTWIQTNHAAFLFVGVAEPPGYGTLNACMNFGTMKVVASSTNFVGRLYNYGTLELGQDSFIGTSNNAITFGNAGLLTVSGTNAMIGVSPAGVNAVSLYTNTGAIVVGDGVNPADLIFKSGSLSVSNMSQGVITVNPGSRLIMRNMSAATRFSNGGSITQDNSGIEFDWAAGVNGGSYNANFHNGGDWLLKNGATFLATSSTNPPRPVSWGLNNSTNVGALTLLGGSLFDVRALYNSGTITMGDNTVLAGFMAGTAKVINNLAHGIIGVTGTNAVIGWTNLTSAANSMVLNNGSPTDTGATFAVGNGVSTGSVSIQGDGFVSLLNYAGNTVNVARAASLGILSVKTNASDSIVALTNLGVFVQSGTVSFRPNQWGVMLLDNFGTYQIGTGLAETGTVARRIGLGSAFAQPSTFRNFAGATFMGTGLMLYTNVDNIANRYSMSLENYGTIAPGAPLGTLELRNVGVTNKSGSSLAIQLYDPTNHDKLQVTGTGASFNIASGSTLNISLVDRYRWTGTTTFRIVEGPVSGTFDSLLWNGAPVAGQYAVSYGANYIDIVVRGPNGSMVIVR